MNIWINFTSPETNMIVLPDAETARSYLHWVHSSGQNIGRTDRQMDRIPLAITALYIASNADVQ